MSSVQSDVKLPGDLTDDLRGPSFWVAMRESLCCQLRDRSHPALIPDDILTVRHEAPAHCLPRLLPFGWVWIDQLRNARKGVVQDIVDAYGNFLNLKARAKERENAAE